MKQMNTLMKSFILSIFGILLSVNIVFSQTYEHIIMYGQSLSTGQQSWPPLSTTAVPNNYMIGNQVWTNYGNTSTTTLNPLISTLALDGYATQLKIIGSQMTCECPIVSVANHIQLKTGGKKYIASSCGYGGKRIEQLSKEYYNPVNYGDFTNAITYAYNITKNVHCPALFWMQGEYNYNITPICLSASDGLTGGAATGNKARYKSLLLTLKNNMQADIMTKYGQADKPVMITYQVGKQYSAGKTLEIGMAQLELSNEYSDIVCAGPVYNMPDRGGHLDPNGYRWYGEMLGKAFYKTKILGEDFRPLQPLQLSRTIDSKVIKIKFHVPVLPLVFETNLVQKFNDFGFQVFLNGSDRRVTLSSVVINGDCVELTSTTSLVGDVEVVYAGVGTSGKGNLRDSDPYSSTSSYIDLDKQVNNVYVYEHDASVTSLRSPVYEPKAVDGTPIYDKPYPLFNFSMAFYYKLNAADQLYDVPNLTSKTTMVNVSNVSITPASLSVNVGQSLSISSTISPVNATNSSILWTSGNPSVAYVINGVVTAVGAGTAVITARSVDQGKSATCNVTCVGITQTPYPTILPHSITSNIEFEGFDNGGEGLAYHDLNAGNLGGVYRTDVNVDIIKCTDGGYNINNTGAGEWLEYTVNVPAAGNYSIALRYAASTASKVNFQVSGVSLTGSINLPATYTGTMLVYQTVSTPLILAAGIQKIRFLIESGNSNYNYFKISNVISAIQSPTSSGNDVLKIFPNPSVNIIQAIYTSDKAETVSYEIIDNSGKSYMKSIYLCQTGENRPKIDISTLPEGIFFLKINSKIRTVSAVFCKRNQ